jgi:hypothetical protein
VKDPALVLGWIWAVYLLLRLGIEAVRDFVPFRPTKPAARASTNRGDAGAPGRETRRSWTPLPAILWLAGETVLALLAVGILWLILRDVSMNLVPAAVSAASGDVRRVALAVILGWSLFVINVPVAWRLIGRVLPAESKKASGGVDPERMGGTIGVLERLLIVALVPGGGPSAVGFVVAAKTLARFKKLDKKRFAERYLLGTMASVTIAVVSALVAQWIWTSQP